MSFDISVLPKEEGKSFLVLAPAARGWGEVAWHQVSWFEGNLYPDALGSNVDYTDRIVLDTIIDYAELPKENKQMKTQETTQAWALEYPDGTKYPYLFSTRQEARWMKVNVENCEPKKVKVVKVQIQVLN